ncbi:hypothetical protein [Mesorhizobium sp. M0772]|uniref:hypothetical protein n=1 Tax=Mesorhizobium sp. M0772 TaxID=2956998 RepID=UPI00333C562B
MDEDQKSFLTHLRSTHFSLVVLCLVAVFAISQVTTANITKAMNQLNGVIAATNKIQLNSLLTKEEGSNEIGLARYQVSKTDAFDYHGGSLESSLKDEDQIYVLFPRQKLKSDYWNCQNPFVPSIEPAPYNPHLVSGGTDLSLARFIQIWNDLGEVVLLGPNALPDQLELEPRDGGATVIGSRQYPATYLSNVPVLLTCLDAGEIGLYLTVGDVNQNDRQGWVADIRANIRQVKYTGEIMPIRVNWRERLAKGIDYLPQSDSPASFKESFPELEELTTDSQSETLNANLKILQVAEKISPASVSLFGLSVPLRFVVTWGAAAIAIIQLYFYINIAAYFNKYPYPFEVTSFPWVPTFSSWLAHLTSWLTIVIIPAAIVLYLIYVGFSKISVLEIGPLSIAAISSIISVCTARTMLLRKP